MHRKSLSLCLAAVAWLLGGRAQAETLTLACGSTGQDVKQCQLGAEAWAKKTGHTVKVVPAPADAGEQLTLYQQQLAAGASDIDVYRIDAVWPGMLAGHLVDLTPLVPKEELERHFPALVENNRVGGKLVALPWFTDAGVLYYRKDLLEKHGQRPPATWQEMAAVARTVLQAEREAGNDKLVGFVFQAKASESLTCNALEWVDSFGGGSVVDASGKVTINNPKAVEALQTAASWVNTISPRGVLNYGEEEARGVFQSGNAVFMRNWPYAWALSQAADSPIKGKVGVVALPRGGPAGKSTGALGGWQLSVSRYSEHQELAVELIRYLTGPEEQKRRALAISSNPTLVALYKDAEILEANPFFGNLYDTFLHAVARPARVTGSQYSRVSAEFRNAVHATLSGRQPADRSLKALQSRLERLRRKGQW